MPKKLGVTRANVIRPQVVPPDLANAYREIAADERREGEAHEWAEAMLRDFPERDR